jgi:hypothetical protein
MSTRGRRERPEKSKNAPGARISGAGVGPPVRRVLADVSCRQLGNFPSPIGRAPATVAIAIDGNIRTPTFTSAMLCPSVDAALASRRRCCCRLSIVVTNGANGVIPGRETLPYARTPSERGWHPPRAASGLWSKRPHGSANRYSRLDRYPSQTRVDGAYCAHRGEVARFCHMLPYRRGRSGARRRGAPKPLSSGISVPRRPAAIARCGPHAAAHIETVSELASFLELERRLWRPLLPRYEMSGKRHLTPAIGCTGGRHRPVVASVSPTLELHETGWGAAPA